MRKIKAMQQKKKVLEDQEQMRRKQEILKQVLGVGGGSDLTKSKQTDIKTVTKNDHALLGTRKQLSSYKGAIQVLDAGNYL